MGLQRFRDAQAADYATALAEVRAGRKRSHWMWYIFPQVHGLGYSRMADYYAIRDIAEARAYLADPLLGAHLVELCEVLLHLPTDDAHAVFGSPDDLKLRSCMTLFEAASAAPASAAAPAGEPSVFARVLEKYYGDRRDERTLSILAEDARLRPPGISDRQVYETDIGPVCMSRDEHEAYLRERDRRAGGI